MKIRNWLGRHHIMKHILLLLMVIAIAWWMGQFVGPALMKILFL